MQGQSASSIFRYLTRRGLRHFTRGNDLVILPPEDQANASLPPPEPSEGVQIIEGTLWLRLPMEAPVNLNESTHEMVLESHSSGTQVTFFWTESSFNQHKKIESPLNAESWEECLESSSPWPRLTQITIDLRILMSTGKLASLLSQVETLVINNPEGDDISTFLECFFCPRVSIVFLGPITYKGCLLVRKSFPDAKTLHLSSSLAGQNLSAIYDCGAEAFQSITTVLRSNSATLVVDFDPSKFDSLALTSRRNGCMWFHLLMLVNFLNKVFDGVVSVGPVPIIKELRLLLDCSDPPPQYFLHRFRSADEIYVRINRLDRLILPSLSFATTHISLTFQDGDPSYLIYWSAKYAPALRILDVICETSAGYESYKGGLLQNLRMLISTYPSFEFIQDVLECSPKLRMVFCALSEEQIALLGSKYPNAQLRNISAE